MSNTRVTDWAVAGYGVFMAGVGLVVGAALGDAGGATWPVLMVGVSLASVGGSLFIAALLRSADMKGHGK